MEWLIVDSKPFFGWHAAVSLTSNNQSHGLTSQRILGGKVARRHLTFPEAIVKL